MNLKIIIPFLFLFSLLLENCSPQVGKETPVAKEEVQPEVIIKKDIIPAAHLLDQYITQLKGKNIGLVVNQTSMINDQHLVDVLLGKGIKVVQIFAPEHGFRGKADAGEKVADGKDVKTGIPLTSLYGKKKKPLPSDLKGIDLILFDIQDVGARFYTYISSMHYVMEACAENDVAMLVLDRPNPNGHYVDGPVLDLDFQSFVGMHEVPIVHGMTIAEYAQMINGEKWLAGGVQCDLSYVLCENYDHSRFYELPVKPSPNLPNIKSIYLYPSLCLFEGTRVSIGRGTNTQFQVYGDPDFKGGNYTFVPQSMEGAKYPKHEGKTCYGYKLNNKPFEQLQTGGFNLSYLIDFYEGFSDQKKFFLANRFFDKLAGSDQLRKQIMAGETMEDIKASWEKDLNHFKQIRQKYLLYKE